MVIDKKLKQYILILMAGAIWGTIGVFMRKLDLLGSTPEYTTFLRMLFAFIMLFLITVFKEGIESLKINKSTLWSCVLLGIFPMFLQNICYNNAVNRLGMALGGAILYIAPVFTAVLSRIVFKESIKKDKMIALFLNVIGCVLATMGGAFSEVSFTFIGVLFAIGAAISFALLNIFGRLATDECSPFVVTTYNFLFGTIVTIVTTAPWKSLDNPWDKKILFWSFLFALVPTTIAYLLYFTGIQELKETSKVPIFVSVELVVAIILGAVIFKEKISIITIVGVLLIFSAIIKTNQGNCKEDVQ